MHPLSLLSTASAKEIQFHWIDVAILVVYVGVLVAIGLHSARKAAQNLDSYFLGGKSIPWWIVGTSHGASGFDVSGTMWFTAMIFAYGMKGLWVMWIWPVFDRVFRQVYLGIWIRRSNVLTGGEWMKTRFSPGPGHTLSHLSVVIYAVVSTIGWLAYAYRGAGSFADVFFPWDLALGGLASSDVYAILILLVTTFYVLIGGWYSVVLTDLFQFGLMIVASVIIAALAMAKVSPETLAAAVPKGWFDPTFGWKLDLDWSGIIDGLNQKVAADGYAFFGVIIGLWFFRGVMVSMAGPNPGYSLQHQLCTKDPRETALENWIMSPIQFIPRYLMMTGIAVLGLAYFTPTINQMIAEGGIKAFDFERVLPFVIRDLVPVGVTGLLVAGLLSAFMSTFTAQLNGGAAYVVADIYKKYINPNAAPKRYVRMSYLVSVGLVVVSVLVGTQIENVNKITGIITGLLFAGFLAPNLLKWHWWRFNGYGYFWGMMGGIAAAAAFMVVEPALGRAFPQLGSSMITTLAFFLLTPTSLVCSIVATLRTPPDDEKVLDDFYINVRPWGFWKPVHDRVVARHPGLQPNRDFKLDMLNVAIACVWQLGLVLAPMALVTKQWGLLWGALAVTAVLSWVMKRTWYDRLGKNRGYLTDLPPGYGPAAGG